MFGKCQKVVQSILSLRVEGEDYTGIDTILIHWINGWFAIGVIDYHELRKLQEMLYK